MSLALLCVIFFISMFHKNSDKSLMFAALSFFSAVHYLIAGQLPGDDFGWYYVTSAILLFLLSRVFGYKKDNAVFHLIVCLGIFFNMSGYIMWEIEEATIFSYLGYLGLYCYTIIVLLSDRAYDQGNRTALFISGVVCRYIYKSDNRHLAKAKGENAC